MQTLFRLHLHKTGAISVIYNWHALNQFVFENLFRNDLIIIIYHKYDYCRCSTREAIVGAMHRSSSEAFEFIFRQKVINISLLALY